MVWSCEESHQDSEPSSKVLIQKRAAMVDQSESDGHRDVTRDTLATCGEDKQKGRQDSRQFITGDWNWERQVSDEHVEGEEHGAETHVDRRMFAQ